MPAQFPTNVRVFTTKVDLQSFVVAEDVNLLQDEVTAVENTLGTGLLTSTWPASYTTSTSWASLTARLSNIEGYLGSLNSSKLDASSGVTASTPQTLTNKTLIEPVIGTIINTGTLTLPTSTDTLVGRTTADTLSNKTLVAPIISSAGASFSGTTGTTVLRASSSASGTLTLPAATDTLVGRATTDTLTNKTLDGTLNTFSNIPAAAVTGLSSGYATLTTTQTLTNKTLTAPIISTIVNTGTLTLPTSTDTLVGRATTDTLTNKTLSGGSLTGSITNSGTITGGTYANPTFTGTIAGLPSADLVIVPITSGTAITPALSNAHATYNVTSTAGTVTLTLPSDATTAFATGTTIGLIRNTAQAVQFAAGSGATVIFTPALTLRAVYSFATAIKIAANTWLISGDLG